MLLNKVNVLGQVYKVICSNKGIPEEVISSIYGTCDRENSRIWINSTMNLEHKYRTLFHEMGHSTFYRSGVVFSGAIPAELEEILVEVFATQQYEYLRDFIKGLLKHEDTNIRELLQQFIKGK